MATRTAPKSRAVSAPSAEVMAAAREYRDLRDRRTNPVGSFDKAGRWWPTVACACAVRTPSRAWPYSYLVHCRTADHVAETRGVARVEVLRAARALDKAGS